VLSVTLLRIFYHRQALFLSELSINEATATKRWALREIFSRGGNAKTNRTPTENSGRFDKIKYLDD
jgi:hypothetical protein